SLERPSIDLPRWSSPPNPTPLFECSWISGHCGQESPSRRRIFPPLPSDVASLWWNGEGYCGRDRERQPEPGSPLSRRERGTGGEDRPRGGQGGRTTREGGAGGEDPAPRRARR